MPKYQKFEDLPVWQEAARLYNKILDLLQERNLPLTPGFRGQMERAALSVSNNIAEGFERVTTKELTSFIAIARGSAGEVRSMIAVVKSRPGLKLWVPRLNQIRELAESCGRQLTAWTLSVENSRVQGKRHLSGQARIQNEAQNKARLYKINFLKSLKPNHPLFNSSEAREARGEVTGDSQ